MRCPHLRVGGELHDRHPLCLKSRKRLFLEDLGTALCPFGMRDAHPRPPWRKTEDIWLASNFSRLGSSACADWLGRPIEGIRVRAKRLGIAGRRRHPRWSAADNQRIRSELSGLTRNERQTVARRLAWELGRTPLAVSHRAWDLGVSTRRRWSSQEIAALRHSYPRHLIREVAQAFQRTPSAVRAVASRRDIHATKGLSLRCIMRLLGTSSWGSLPRVLAAHGLLTRLRAPNSQGHPTRYNLAVRLFARWLTNGSNPYNPVLFDCRLLETLLPHCPELADLCEYLHSRVLRVSFSRSTAARSRRQLAFALRDRHHRAAQRGYLLFTDCEPELLGRLLASHGLDDATVAQAWPERKAS